MARRDDFEQVAEGVPFDDSNVDFTADNVQDAIEELEDAVAVSASPGFSFGRNGNLPTNTWLLRPGGVPSNKTGINVGITGPYLKKITCATENQDTYNITIYQHDGDEVNLTSITTKTITSSRKEVFDVDISLTYDKQLAVRVTSGSATNLGVDLQLSGTV
jgi:hypothetical protein